MSSNTKFPCLSGQERALALFTCFTRSEFLNFACVTMSTFLTPLSMGKAILCIATGAALERGLGRENCLIGTSLGFAGRLLKKLSHSWPSFSSPSFKNVASIPVFCSCITVVWSFAKGATANTVGNCLGGTPGNTRMDEGTSIISTMWGPFSFWNSTSNLQNFFFECMSRSGVIRRMVPTPCFSEW